MEINATCILDLIKNCVIGYYSFISFYLILGIIPAAKYLKSGIFAIWCLLKKLSYIEAFVQFQVILNVSYFHAVV